MKKYRNILTSPSQGRGIQLDIIAKLLLTSLVSTIILIVGLVFLSLLLADGRDSFIISADIQITLFSPQYFEILGCIFGIGAIASAVAALLVGLPFGRTMKSSLQDIRDANEIVSRGRLNYRLEIKGYIEIEQIAEQFNRMAQRTEKQVESLQRLVNENKELIQGAEETASMEERRKMARELHDAISQQLFAINTTLSAIPLLMDDKPDEAKKYIAIIGKMVTAAQQELRALIMHLRPANLEGYCLKDGITKLLEEIDDKNEAIRVQKDINDTEGVPAGIENNIFRVTQEAISNILRHAKATTISVKLFQRDKVLILIIEDNGIGMNLDESKKTSYGLGTMRERIEEIGGRFDLISYPMKGTRIEIRVPVGLQGIYK